MLTKIILTLLSFLLFLYIFLFKLIKKNDTNYIIFLIIQTIGILVNFIQILFNKLKYPFCNYLVWVFTVIIPLFVIVMEYKKVNVSELIYICICKIYIYLGNNKKAKDVLINITNKYPESYFAHKNLAIIYEKEGGMRKAIDEYVKTLEIKRNDYKSYYKISLILKDLGRNKQAILMLNNLLKVKPDHFEASLMLSKLLIEKEDFKKAIAVINNALKIKEDNEELIYNLGISYARINEFQLAKACFEKVVNLNNANYNAYYRLGQISLLYREYDMAEHYFLGSAFEEKEAKSYYELAKIYMMKNNKEKAALVLGKAIDINPKYYKIATEEPMLFSIKQLLDRPKICDKNINEVEKTESKTEKMIEEYLSNTYDLTKILNNNKDKNFNWNKKNKK